MGWCGKICHEESVLAGVLVEGPEHTDGLEFLLAEEQLGSQVRFADLQSDAVAVMAGNLADELGRHLGAHVEAAPSGMDHEIEDVEFVLVQLVDHEADDFFAVLGHHADAIALSEAAEEIFLILGIFEAKLFGLQDFGHIAPNYPANVYANLFILCSTSVHIEHLSYCDGDGDGM